MALALASISSEARAQAPKAAAKPPLVVRLGFPADAKVLILNGDDTGMNHSTNVGTFRAFKAGGLSSATIMVPCPWFQETVIYARENPKANLGLHLTLTSEWRRYKWGPVLGRTAVPSLVDELGNFYDGVEEVYAHAKLDEVELEVRAQVDRALKAGIDVTHVDSHMGTLQYDPKYHELYLKIARAYNLPCRVAGRELMRTFKGEHLVDMADEMGVVHPDMLYTDGPEKVEDTERFWLAMLDNLPAGQVSEIFIHCGELTPEMEFTANSWRTRAADTDFFCSAKWTEALKAKGIRVISYRELRDLQRAQPKAAP
jgi:predicted glycoside hydrolase/deacetylase ChbG (UPF0249 family)